MKTLFACCLASSAVLGTADARVQARSTEELAAEPEAAHGAGDFGRCANVCVAAALAVSVGGLRRRMTQLGIVSAGEHDS